MTMRIASSIVLLACSTGAMAQAGTVYRCPGPPVLYTDQISAKEAADRGCRTIENAPITVVAPPKPRPLAAASNGASRPGNGEKGEQRVDPKEQRARDSDARKILEGELKKEEDALGAMQKDFNNGEPERQGGERNFAKYQERVEGMREAITRKQADIAAIKREIAKLPAPKPE
jgi:hypothetical protein